MMTYLALKHLHMTCVAMSGFGFLARGVLSLRNSPLLDRRELKIAPHLIDTVLLASAIGLAVLTSQYPIAQNWLTAKVVALIVYILCGMMALRRSLPIATRAFFFVAALAVFLYIVSVALTHHPLGVFLFF
jgi:uncharacterized membrane protein SirB2